MSAATKEGAFSMERNSRGLRIAAIVLGIVSACLIVVPAILIGATYAKFEKDTETCKKNSSDGDECGWTALLFYVAMILAIGLGLLTGLAAAILGIILCLKRNNKLNDETQPLKGSCP
jgi:hypothetical protein